MRLIAGDHIGSSSKHDELTHIQQARSAFVLDTWFAAVALRRRGARIALTAREENYHVPFPEYSFAGCRPDSPNRDGAHNFASHPEWNRHEDQAYRIWAKENQRRYNNNFAKAKESDQRANWGWRHEHSDTVLKIVIR